MRKKNRKAPIAGVIIAAVLVVTLMISGTLLRMRSRGMAFMPAFKSFMTDTFMMNRQN